MNKELIKKYKAEFTYWLNGGSVLLGIRDSITSIIKWYPSVTDPFEEESTSGELLIIINDDYCTYRKALVEGKTVQAYYKFNDTWNDIIKPEFKDNVSNYRIKPEEPKFKIGDFIRQTKELGINVSSIYNKQKQICSKTM